MQRKEWASTLGITARSVSLAVVIAVGAACAVPVSPAYGGAGADLDLTWTAPGYPGQQAVAYDLRIASTPPGADTLSWWESASPVLDVPVPAEAGTQQSARLHDLLPGQTVFAAIRARYADGQWSAITTVTAWTAPSGPFLQEAAPPVVTVRGETGLMLRGLRLGNVESVRCRVAGVGEVPATITETVGDTLLRVTADLSPFDGMAADVVVTGAAGQDTLRGWVWVELPEPPDTEPPEAVENLHASQVTETSLRLSWTAPTDPCPHGPRRVASYEVRRLGGSPGAWSWETGSTLSSHSPGPPGASEALLVSGLTAEGTYAFALVSVDSAGNVSPVSNTAAITLAPPVVEVGPEPVGDLLAEAVNETTVRLVWTAPAVKTPEGGTVAASSYDMRRLAGVPGAWSWENGQRLDAGVPAAPGEPESLVVEGLPPGSRQGFAVVSADADSNVSRLSNIAVVVLPLPPDTTAPAAVTDLNASVGSEGQVLLTWTAPADDRGSVQGYEGRCGWGDRAEFRWEEADTLVSPPGGAPPGSVQRWAAGAVPPGGVAVFALCAVDSAGNRSPVSNLAVVDRRGEDTVPPAEPAGMEATRFGVGAVQIRWTAPGDDGTTGRAARYELRHAVSPVGEDWIAGAEEVPGVHRPKAPGKQEFVNLRDLEGGKVHLFALRAFDEAGLASGWATAMVYVDGPAEIADASPPLAPDSLRAGRKESVWTGPRLRTRR